MLDCAVGPVERADLPPHLAFVCWCSEEVSPTGLKRPRDFPEDQIRLVDVLHDVQRDHKIEASIRKCLGFEIFGAETSNNRSQCLTRKQLASNVARTFAF